MKKTKPDAPYRVRYRVLPSAEQLTHHRGPATAMVLIECPSLSAARGAVKMLRAALLAVERGETIRANIKAEIEENSWRETRAEDDAEQQGALRAVDLLLGPARRQSTPQDDWLRKRT